MADGVTYPNGLAVTFSASNAAFANLLSQLYPTTTTNTVTLDHTGLALGLATVFKGVTTLVGTRAATIPA